MAPVLSTICAIGFALSLLLRYYPSDSNLDGAIGLGNDGYYLPRILLAVALVVLVWIPRSRPVGLAILVPFVAFNVYDVARNSDGSSYFQFPEWAPAPWLGAIGALAGLAALWIAFVSRELRVSLSSSALVSSGIAAALTLAWVVSYWLPWSRDVFAITKGDQTWEATGTRFTESACCRLFESVTFWPNEIHVVLLVVGTIGLGVFLPTIMPRIAAGAAVAALGVGLLAVSVGFIVGLAGPDLPATDYGYSEEQVSSMGIVVTHSGLLGGWIATICACVLVLVGIFLMMNSCRTSAHRADTLRSGELQ